MSYDDPAGDPTRRPGGCSSSGRSIDNIAVRSS
jgi:hypothetical protein